MFPNFLTNKENCNNKNQRTPLVLIPFIVCTEKIRNFIQPRRLANHLSNCLPLLVEMDTFVHMYRTFYYQVIIVFNSSTQSKIEGIFELIQMLL